MERAMELQQLAREKWAVFAFEHAEAGEFGSELWARSTDVAVLAYRLVTAAASLAAFVGVPLGRRALVAARDQPKPLLVAEATLAAVLVVLHLLRRWLRTSPLVRRVRQRFISIRATIERSQARAKASYLAFIRSIGEKSRVAAAMLPHAAFFLLVTLANRSAPETARALWRAPQLTAALLGYQLVLADMAARCASRASARLAAEGPPAASVRVSSPAKSTASASTALAVSRSADAQIAEHECRVALRFWCAFAAIFAAGAAVVAAPYGAAAWAAVPLGARLRALELRGVMLLWLQLPLLGSVDVAFSAVRAAAWAVAPSLARRKAQSSKPSAFAARWAKVEPALAAASTALSFFAPPFFASRLQSLRRGLVDLIGDGDSWVLLLAGGVALCTIGPPVRLGVVAVGYVLPLLATIKCVDDFEDPRAARLLAYWMVLAAREAALLNDSVAQIARWIPLRSRFEIILFLYLQLPYTRGAEKLHAAFHAKCKRYIDRFKEA
ncbi:hypothetical protein M885DRAFT_585277 [Pelagophyceae sp. CCMP2097]|nr:hypothetical protein M885DRAFT_585277 [Pelagophyceae sp. CCMP2097]